MKMEVKGIIFLSLLIMSMGNLIYATAQVPDCLIYNNEKLALSVNPLEPFLEKNGIRTTDLFPIIVKDGEMSFSMSTSCWRGYVATFEISGDRLYLIDISECPGNRTADLKAIFKEKFKEGRVFADWYTGKLFCPRGKMTRYVHMGYMSEFERELTIDVRDGDVLAVDEYENKSLEIPDRYKLIHYPSFEAVLPGNLKPCEPQKTPAQHEDLYCLMSPDQTLRLEGRTWLCESRLYGDDRYKWIKEELSAVKQEKELLYTFEEVRLSKSRWGHMGWIEGKDKEGNTRICLFAMSNINSRFQVIFSARGGTEKEFKEMIEIFTGSVKLTEYGH